jgi:TPR repeat protein
MAVPMDKSMAAKWYQKAADQKIVGVQCNLGLLYQTGEGEPMDNSMAAKWFQKAADQEYAEAQYNLVF